MAILEIDKDSGILMIDDKLDAAEAEVKEEISDVVVVNIDSEGWTKPDYEDTVTETIEDDTDNKSESDITRREILITSKCQKVTKRKMSLDSLSLSPKKIKLDKRTLSVGSGRDINDHRVPNPMNEEYLVNRTHFVDSGDLAGEIGKDPAEIGSLEAKKKVKKENFKRKAEEGNIAESNSKRAKKSMSNGITCPVKTASAMSIMETINNVIQQSVQMTSRTDDDINIVSTCNDSSNSGSINISNVIVNSGKSCNVKERDSKRKSGNLLSIIKNVPKTIAKSDKLGFKDCKLIDKDKGGGKDGSGKARVKNKIGMVKNKVLEDKGRKAEAKCAGGKGRIVKIQDREDKEDKEGKKPAALVKKKSNKKSTNTKKICGAGKKAPGRDESVVGVLDSFSSLTKKSFLKPKWSNGWSWEGDSYEAKVYLTVIRLFGSLLFFFFKESLKEFF